MADLKRKAMKSLETWKNDASSSHALLVDGPRQVGKTYLIREFGRKHYNHMIEINLLEVEGAAEVFNAAANSDDLFARITLYANEPLVPHETLIFIDAVQRAPEMITAAKFLVQKEGHNYDFVFSGSMLGVELHDIESWPVGYLQEVRMYPLDFEEFCWACGVVETVLEKARDKILDFEEVDPFAHERLLELFYYYLVVGGMPQAVSAYVDSNNLQSVRTIQEAIVAAYRRDIAQYCKDDSLMVKNIYDAIPSQLNSQSKRYTVTQFGKSVRVSRKQNSFLWLTNAGVAIAVYNVDEPRCPLAFVVNSTLFKLFMNDVGLLACASGLNVVRKTLERESVNYGAVYENYVAQALIAQGIAPYYYRNRKLGELDFVVQSQLGLVLPIEVKSGKDYKRHAALNNVLDVENYDLRWGLVLSDGNVKREGGIIYAPIYAASFASALLERLEAI